MATENKATNEKSLAQYAGDFVFELAVMATSCGIAVIGTGAMIIHRKLVKASAKALAGAVRGRLAR